jgi:hypothetical protein
MDSSTLGAELSRAEQRHWAATTVAEHHETLARQWQRRADELTAQLATITAKRPHVSIAETILVTERAVAARMDELHILLSHSRLSPSAPRGPARHDLVDEMGRLTKSDPGLVDQAGRDRRWATVMERAEAAEQRWLADIRAQLDEAVGQVEENAAVARPARADIDERAERIATLRAELERRAEPSPTPGHSRSPNVGADVVLAGGGRVPEPVTVPVATAAAEPVVADSCPPGQTVESLRAQIPDDRRLESIAPGATNPDVPFEDRDRPGEEPEHSRRHARRLMPDIDLETRRSALARAEQQLDAATYLAGRYDAVRQQWQDTADTLNREL